MVTKHLDIKNRTYYFWDDQINIKNFNSAMLKLDKKSSIGANIYYISYVTKKPEYNINSVNPLYLIITELDGFIEEKNGSKYLNIASTNGNSELLKKYAEVWRGIKDQIKKINNSVGEHDKDYMKIKFDSDDDLPLNVVVKFCILTIVIRCIFEKDGKYYPQIFLNNNKSKECDFCHYWYFLDKNFNYQPYLCNSCHDLMMKAVSFNDVAVVSVKINHYRIHFSFMSKNDAINLLNNSMLSNKEVL